MPLDSRHSPPFMHIRRIKSLIYNNKKLVNLSKIFHKKNGQTADSQEFMLWEETEE
jgi:hypothetical protein